jgi:L-alanine-DL-glutamate epimerase-like enolase superfamily enzyme
LKITRVEVFPVTIPYPEAYVMASSSTAARNEVIIKVHTDQGIVGLGEAVARHERGQTQEVMTIVLAKYFAPALIGEDPLDIERIIDKLGGMDCPWLSTLHAVDNALYDIMGKAFGVPVYQLLGGAVRKSISLTRSLPIKSPGEMAERAVALKEQGYHTLTVKIGFDPNEDMERLMAVKRAVGDWPPLEVDPNEGYTADVAIQTLKPVQDLLTCVEQPVSRYDFMGMAKVAAALDTPVAADQMLTSARHVALAARLGAADVMCLKLPEVGGIALSRKFLEVARAFNLPVTMGSGHPLGVGTAALHHFAAAMEWVRPPIGYGSPLERFANDIVTEPAIVRNGEVTVSDKPGLGVELDETMMKKYAVKITVDHD